MSKITYETWKEKNKKTSYESWLENGGREYKENTLSNYNASNNELKEYSRKKKEYYDAMNSAVNEYNTKVTQSNMANNIVSGILNSGNVPADNSALPSGINSKFGGQLANPYASKDYFEAIKLAMNTPVSNDGSTIGSVLSDNREYQNNLKGYYSRVKNHYEAIDDDLYDELVKAKETNSNAYSDDDANISEIAKRYDLPENVVMSYYSNLNNYIKQSEANKQDEAYARYVKENPEAEESEESNKIDMPDLSVGAFSGDLGQKESETKEEIPYTAEAKANYEYALRNRDFVDDLGEDFKDKLALAYSKDNASAKEDLLKHSGYSEEELDQIYDLVVNYDAYQDAIKTYRYYTEGLSKLPEEDKNKVLEYVKSEHKADDDTSVMGVTNYLGQNAKKTELWDELVEKYGEDKANEYKRYAEWFVDYAESEEYKKNIDKIINGDNKALGALVGFAGKAIDTLNVFGQPIAALNTLWQKNVEGVEVPNVYNKWHNSETLSSGLDEAIIKGIDSDVGAFIYQTADSVVKSAYNMYLSGGLGSGIAGAFNLGEKAAGALSKVIAAPMFSAGAFNQTFKEKLESGVGVESALKTATSSAIFEALFEELSYDKLIKMGDLSKVGRKQLALDAIKQAAVEGSEEINTSIANWAADTLISGDFSKLAMLKRSYEADGYSSDEAKEMARRDMFADIGLSGLGGFIAGGTHVGMKLALDSARVGNLAKNVMNNGIDTVEDLRQSALELDKNSEAYNIASTKSAEEMTKSDIEKVIRSGIMVSSSESSIKDILVQNLSETENISEEEAQAAVDSWVSGSNVTEGNYELSDEVASNILEENKSEYAGSRIVNTAVAAKTANAIAKETDNAIKKAEKEDQKSINKYVKNNGSIEAVKIDDGSEVEIAKFELKGKNNTVPVAVLTNGNRALLSDVKISDDNLERVIKSVATTENAYAVNTAREYYDGSIDTQNFSTAGIAFYNYGYAVASRNEDLAFENINVPNLNEYRGTIQNDAYLKQMYSIGLNAAEKEIKAEEENKAKNPEKKISKSENKEAGKVTDKRNDGSGADDQWKKLADTVAEATGLHIVLTDDIIGGKNTNGNFAAALGRLTINTTADYAYGTLIHELSEFGMTYNQKAMQQLVGTVLDFMSTEKGYSYLNEELKNYRDVYRSTVESGKTLRSAGDEYVFDVMAGVFMTEEGMADFYDFLYNNVSEEKKNSVLQTLTDIFDFLVDKIRSFFSKTTNKSRKDGYKMALDKATELRDQWKSIIQGAMENYNQSESVEGDAAVSNSVEVSEMSTEELNKSYDAAVKENDIKSAQKYVDEAAKRAGYSIKAYHGTDVKDITVFRTDKINNNMGSHFGSKEIAEGFANGEFGSMKEDGKVYSVFLKADNPYETYDWFAQDDAYPAAEAMDMANKIDSPEAWKIIDKIKALNPEIAEMMDDHSLLDETFLKTEEERYVLYKGLRDLLKLGGWDSILYENGLEIVGDMDYIIQNPEQIKSADPITYDDKGNFIPLSERFNIKSDDIRYSVEVDSAGKELTEGQKKRYANVDSLLLDDLGRLKRYYHGSARVDRIGDVFLPERATSGPMAFFTDDRSVAENYAKDKADTSLSRDSKYDSYETQFTVEMNGEEYSVIDLWNKLPVSKRMDIKKRVPHITYNDDYEIVYDESVNNGNGYIADWSIREAKGNYLKLLVDEFLNGGDLYDQEAEFLNVLKLAGIDDAVYHDPNEKHEGVYEVYLNVTKALDTTNIPEDVINALRESAEEAEDSEIDYAADMWDKTSTTPAVWIERLNNDIENGTTHSWTTIPDFVTETLKEFGYDGISDEGGKYHSYSHQVVIPFDSNQVKYIDNENPTDDPNMKYSVEVDSDGIENYILENDINALSIKDRAKVLRIIIENECEGRTVKFIRNGHSYYASLDKLGITKNIKGDNKSDSKGYKAKINIGASGNFIELAEKSLYVGSKDEKAGKTNKFHKNAVRWDYFYKMIKCKGQYYNVLINVKKTSNDNYVYNIEIKKAKSLHDQLRSSLRSNFAYMNSLSYKEKYDKLNNSVEVDSIEALKHSLNVPDWEADFFEKLNSGEWEDNEWEDGSSTVNSNKYLSDVVNVLEEGAKLVGNVELDSKAINKMAREIKKHYSTTIDAKNIADSLTKVFSYIASTEDTSYGTILGIMKEIATPIIENSEDVSAESKELYDNVRSYLKNNKIALTPEQKKEVIYSYGSYNNYRKSLFGIATFSDNGISLDSIWSELCRNAPGLDVGIVAEQQPIALSEYIDSIKPARTNPFNQNKEQAAYDCAMDIFKRYFEYQAENTALEKAEAKLEPIKIGIVNAMKSYKASTTENYKKAVREEFLKAKAEKNAKLKQLAEALERIEADQDAAVEVSDELTAELLEAEKYKYQEKIKQLREQNEDKVARVKAGYKQSRENERYRKNNTTLKNSIKSAVNSLNSMLTSPNVNSHIKKSLVRPVIDVLEAINLDTGKSKTMQEKLAKLSKVYEAYKSDQKFEVDYDENLKNKIDDLALIFADRNYTELTNDELSKVLEIVKALKKQIQNSNRLIQNKKVKDAYEATRSAVDEIESSHGVNTAVGSVVNKYNTWQLNAYREFRKLSGYEDDSVLMSIFNEFQDGELKMLNFEREANNLFAPVLDGKENQKEMKKMLSTKDEDLVDVGITDKNGNKVLITKDMRMSLILHSMNQSNMNHVLGGGVTIPDMELYKKGKYTEAYTKGDTYRFVSYETALKYARANAKWAKNRSDESLKQEFEIVRDAMEAEKQAAATRIDKLVDELSDWEKNYLEKAKVFFHEMTGKYINEVTEELRGYAVAAVKNYFPIKTDPDFTRTEFAGLVMDASLEGWGNLKSRVNASNPIMLEGLSNVVMRQINKTSNYVGYAIPVRDFNMITNKQFNDDRTGQIKSIRKSIKKTWSNYDFKFLENFMKDIQGGRATDSTFLDKLRGNFAGATLTANIGVAMKQAASYPTAAAVLGWGPLGKTLKDVGRGFAKHGIAELEAINPLLWNRTQGMSSQEIAYAKKSNMYKNAPKWMKNISVDLIQNVDTATVTTLEYASKYYVDKNFKELEVGSEEYWQKVSEVFTKVVTETQPNYTVLQRPEVLRNPNQIVKQLVMFKTQPLQNFGIVYDAWNECNAMRTKLKANDTDENREKYKNAKKHLVRAVSSQITAAVTFSAMTIVANMVYHKIWKYDQDDDKNMLEEMLTNLGTGVLSTLFGAFTFGDLVYQLIDEKVFGGTYYGLELNTLALINDTKDSVDKIIEYSEKLNSAETDGAVNKYRLLLASSVWSFVDEALKFYGVPTNNLKNTFESIYLYSSEIAKHEQIGSTSMPYDVYKTEGFAKKAYNALLEGNEEEFNDYISKIAEYKTDDNPVSAAKSDVKKLLQEDYINERISEDETIDILKKYYDMDDEKAAVQIYKWKNEYSSTYEGVHDSMDKFISNPDDQEAFEDVKTSCKELIDTGKEAKDIANTLKTRYKDKYVSANTSERVNMKAAIVKVLNSIGYKTKKYNANSFVDSWTK